MFQHLFILDLQMQDSLLPVGVYICYTDPVPKHTPVSLSLRPVFLILFVSLSVDPLWWLLIWPSFWTDGFPTAVLLSQLNFPPPLASLDRPAPSRSPRCIGACPFKVSFLASIFPLW